MHSFCVNVCKFIAHHLVPPRRCWRAVHYCCVRTVSDSNSSPCTAILPSHGGTASSPWETERAEEHTQPTRPKDKSRSTLDYDRACLSWLYENGHYRLMKCLHGGLIHYHCVQQISLCFLCSAALLSEALVVKEYKRLFPSIWGLKLIK